MAIHIGHVLGVPAPEVKHLPAVWVRNALIKMRVDAMQHERAMKKVEQRRKKIAGAPRARRR